MNKSKKSSDKVDEIEENSKRKLEYKSNIDAFKSSLKSSDEHEEEISKRLDSYRAKEKIKEESEASSPVISKKSSPEYVKPTTISADENRLLEMMRRDADIKSKSLELMNQDLTKEKYEKEIEAKRHEMDAQVSRVEALNANETIKRMKDQILKYAQEVNIYRVEIEALKRQVDIADGNAKTKEEDAKRIQEDYERKIKLIEERHAVQSVKQESRELNELKRENRLLKDAHEEEIRIKFEEIDYLTKRCEKLEAENVSLRVGNKAARDADAKAKKYEEEVHSLRMRLREQLQSKEAAPVTGSNYNNWTKEQLVRELLCIDRAIERFTKENESLMFENKKQAAEIQELNALLYKESQKIDDFKNKIVKESGSVLVAEDDKDLHVKNVKDLGANHVISKKELDEMRERLFKAEKARLDLEQEMTMKEVEYKSEIENLRLQKLESERKLIGMDSALKTQIIENDKLKGDYSNSLNKINTEKEDINLKLKWYMENQGIIEKDSDALQQKDIRIEQLKEEIKSIQAKDGGRKRMATLEKQVKDLQGALAAKNPDSIPLMLNAVKPSFEEKEEYRILKEQNESLKKALQEKDAEFDKRIRTLRIEIDKMKDKYESTKTAGLPEGVKDKRIQDLERQLQETKDYYIDRLKKLEQKTGTAGIINEKKAQIKDEMAYLKEIERLKKENESLKRTPSKFDKNGKEIKINSKEKSTDFIGTINKLMNEDYIFCLWVMLKDTLKIKGMLEKKAKFADCIKDVEELIDHIEKASVSFKSTVFFSKITDKWLELSKILQGEDNAKRDNSIPHQKLTAIEKLIRDEINLKIKQKKDKDETNVDLVVVDIEDKIESQPAPRRKVKEDEDEYWSDFSDDVFTCEVNEESKAQEVLLSLQRWIYASNLESDLKSKYPKTSIITLDEFKDWLSSAGYYCELIDLQTLLKKLEIKDDKGINYKEFLTNISEKNAAWWKETLKNNGFDLNIKGKTGMHRSMWNKAIQRFITNNLKEKTQQAILKAGYLNPKEFINQVFSSKNGITKRNLRKAFLEHSIPLTRLDTHILFKTLENNQEGVVSKESFDFFVSSSNKLSSKGVENKPTTVFQTTIDEEEVLDDLPQSINAPKGDQFEKIQSKLQDHIKSNSIDPEQKLRSLDTKKTGIVDINTFTTFNKNINSPVTAIEQKVYFNKLLMQMKGKVTISDLCN